MEGGTKDGETACAKVKRRSRLLRVPGQEEEKREKEKSDNISDKWQLMFIEHMPCDPHSPDNHNHITLSTH